MLLGNYFRAMCAAITLPCFLLCLSMVCSNTPVIVMHSHLCCISAELVEHFLHYTQAAKGRNGTTFESTEICSYAYMQWRRASSVSVAVML